MSAISTIPSKGMEILLMILGMARFRIFLFMAHEISGEDSFFQEFIERKEKFWCLYVYIFHTINY